MSDEELIAKMINTMWPKHPIPGTVYNAMAAVLRLVREHDVARIEAARREGELIGLRDIRELFAGERMVLATAAVDGRIRALVDGSLAPSAPSKASDVVLSKGPLPGFEISLRDGSVRVFWKGRVVCRIVERAGVDTVQLTSAVTPAPEEGSRG